MKEQIKQDQMEEEQVNSKSGELRELKEEAGEVHKEATKDFLKLYFKDKFKFIEGIETGEVVPDKIKILHGEKGVKQIHIIFIVEEGLNLDICLEGEVLGKYLDYAFGDK